MFRTVLQRVLLQHSLGRTCKNAIPLRWSHLQPTLQKQFMEVPIAGRTLNLRYLWLRDHCRCSECYNFDTFQKNVLIHRFDPDMKAVEGRITDTEQLEVTWSDMHLSKYDLAWLENNALHTDNDKEERRLWRSADDLDLETELKGVPYAEYMNETEVLRNHLWNIHRFGFSIIRDSPVSPEATIDACKRICFVQETLYGHTWTFTSDLAKADTAYTTLGLGAHNDSTYLSLPTGLQVLHCLEHTGDGGLNLLVNLLSRDVIMTSHFKVDGFRAAEELRLRHPDAFQLLSSLQIPHEYKDATTHLKSLDTVLRVDPVTQELVWIRYNPYDRAPLNTVSQELVSVYYDAMQRLAAIIEDKRNELFIKLWPGNILFFDNFRLLHGRSAFTGRRTMTGCYLPRDDWLSRARVVGLKI